jgi:hypothetical protein
MDRNEVYQVLNAERAYQESKWSSNENRDETVADHLLTIEVYLLHAKHELGQNADPIKALENVRKLTAVGVACMEKYGVPERIT